MAIQKNIELQKEFIGVDFNIFSDEKRLSQLRVNSNAITSDLEDKVNELTEELESVQTDDVLKQKLEYWKEKSKAETARIENLEKQIIAHADRATLNKIFG